MKENVYNKRMKMRRIDLYITAEQWDRLKTTGDTGLTVSEHIRRAIDQYLSGSNEFQKVVINTVKRVLEEHATYKSG